MMNWIAINSLLSSPAVKYIGALVLILTAFDYYLMEAFGQADKTQYLAYVAGAHLIMLAKYIQVVACPEPVRAIQSYQEFESKNSHLLKHDDGLRIFALAIRGHDSDLSHKLLAGSIEFWEYETYKSIAVSRPVVRYIVVGLAGMGVSPFIFGQGARMLTTTTMLYQSAINSISM